MVYLVYCHSLHRQREEVGYMDMFFSFLTSVMAGIASFYICKWLDRRNGGN
jgi:hypothetical protein